LKKKGDAMNISQLWNEPQRKRPVPAQAFVAVGLLVALLLGTSVWQAVPENSSPSNADFSATKSQ